MYSANIGVKLTRHPSGLDIIRTLTNSLTYDCDFKSWYLLKTINKALLMLTQTSFVISENKYK